MEKNKYLYFLYFQFLKSVGEEYVGQDINEDNDFLRWLIVLVKNTKLYINYLNYLDVVLDKDSMAEIGKGKYDTLGQDSVTIVSPYANTLSLPSGSLVVNNEDVLIKSNSHFETSKFKTFLTQNPYLISELDNFIKLHNRGLDICVGVFGNVYDEDRESKLFMMDALEKNLNGEYKGLYYDMIGDSYFCCLKSNKLIKKHVLKK